MYRLQVNYVPSPFFHPDPKWPKSLRNVEKITALPLYHLATMAWSLTSFPDCQYNATWVCIIWTNNIISVTLTDWSECADSSGCIATNSHCICTLYLMHIMCLWKMHKNVFPYVPKLWGSLSLTLHIKYTQFLLLVHFTGVILNVHIWIYFTCTHQLFISSND